MAYETESPDSLDETPPAGLFEKLKAWFQQDRDARIEWAKEAELDYGWSAPGGTAQWEEADRLALKAKGRPCVTFNRILPVIQSVCGMEINDRKEVKYLPRTTQTSAPSSSEIPGQSGMGVPMPGVQGQDQAPGLLRGASVMGNNDGGGQGIPGADDTGPAETLSSAADYLRDQCDAEDEESDAFQDTVTVGMGWVETRVDYEMNADGELAEDRIDPLEMVWDCKANKRNLIDGRRNWRVREIDLDEAQRRYPDKQPEDLDAAWAKLEGEKQPHDREAARNYPNSVAFDPSKKTVTLVEGEYWVEETNYKVVNLATDEVQDVAEDQIKTLRTNARTAGIPLKIAKQNKRVYYTCVIGADILEYGESQSQECFKRQAITGYRDRNAKQWVGLVRAMRDPQKWANALFSSVLHQIQVSGKGIIAEADAFENWQQAERDWANGAKIVKAKTGSLSGGNPKIKEKQQNNIPPGTFDLMTFALGAFRDVTGVNVEAMGLADRQQAASLELQRRQAASTILAPFFDGMRRYRKDNGRLILDLIKNYLSDGRLIRIVGPDYERYVPLIKQDDTIEYDIIIDESATSPNQKQKSWDILQQMLPVLAKNLTPATTGILLKASPLPQSLVNEFKNTAQKEAENRGPSPEEQMLQLKQMESGANIELKKMDLQLKQHELQQTQITSQADLQMKGMDLRAKQMEIASQAAQHEHDGMMQQREQQGAQAAAETEMMAPHMPAMADGLQQLAAAVAQGQEALANSLAQVAQSVALAAQAMQQSASAMAAPKVAKLSADGLTATIEPVTMQ